MVLYDIVRFVTTAHLLRPVSTFYIIRCLQFLPHAIFLHCSLDCSTIEDWSTSLNLRRSAKAITMRLSVCFHPRLSILVHGLTKFQTSAAANDQTRLSLHPECVTVVAGSARVTSNRRLDLGAGLFSIRMITAYERVKI